MRHPRRFALIASASGCGKTTLGRELARRLQLPFVELDAWVHGPNWTELPDAELRARVEPVLALDGWVIDGVYIDKLGDLVLSAADEIVWLDLPRHVWLPRLLRRTARRLAGRERLWNGNRESLRGAFWGRESLVGHALANYPKRRREYPARFRELPVTRLRSTAAVAAWLADTSAGR